jgi:zinc protease
MRDSGVFAVGVNLKPGNIIDDALELSYREIWKLRNVLVEQKELEKAKTQVMKDIVDSLKTMDGKARALAVNEIMTGSYQTLFSDLEKYRMVTAQEIKDVAAKYMTQNRRSIVSLEPKMKKD